MSANWNASRTVFFFRFSIFSQSFLCNEHEWKLPGYFLSVTSHCTSRFEISGDVILGYHQWSGVCEGSEVFCEHGSKPVCQRIPMKVAGEKGHGSHKNGHGQEWQTSPTRLPLNEIITDRSDLAWEQALQRCRGGAGKRGRRACSCAS